MNLLESFAQTLAGDSRISVVMHARECKVDQVTKKITLPAVEFPEDKVPLHVVGYLDHEVSHLLFTDPLVQIRLVKYFRPKGRYEVSLGNYMRNLFEDVRVEQLFINRYPGGNAFLHAAAMAHQRLLLEREAAESVPNKALCDKRLLAGLAYLWDFCGNFYKLNEVKYPKAVTDEAFKIAKGFPSFATFANKTSDQVGDFVITFMEAHPFKAEEAVQEATKKIIYLTKEEAEEFQIDDAEPGDDEEYLEAVVEDDSGEEEEEEVGMPVPSNSVPSDEENENEHEEESDDSEDFEFDQDDASGTGTGGEDEEGEGSGGIGGGGAGENDKESSEEKDDVGSGDTEFEKEEPVTPKPEDLEGEEADKEAEEFLKSTGHEARQEEFEKQINDLIPNSKNTETHGVYPPFSTKYDTVVQLANIIEEGLRHRPALAQAVSESIEAFDATTTNILGAAHKKFIGKHRVRNIMRDDDGIEFSEEAYSAIAIGENPLKNLYMDKDYGASIKGTAVTLALDVSGSMCDSMYGSATLFGKSTMPAVAAVWSVYAMASALRMPFEIIAFTTIYHLPNALHEDYYKAAGLAKYGFLPYHRVEPTMHFVVKPFNEKFSMKHKQALVALLGAGSSGAFLGLSSVRDYVGGSAPSELKIPNMTRDFPKITSMLYQANCDGDTLAFCRERILAQRENKRIIIVVSDGNPVANYLGNPEAGRNFLKYEINRTTQRGVQVVGIGISSGGGYVKDMYPSWRYLPQPETLGQTLFELL